MKASWRIKPAPVLTCLLVLLVSEGASAQPFPTKPIRIFVGFSPGGGADVVARGLAGGLGERLGQQVIVDNRPGANGLIAAELTAKAAPDGHTLLLSPGNYAFGPAMDPKWSLDMASAFAPVSLLAVAPLLVVVHPSLPVKSIKELIALAKTHPNKLSYASGGIGGSGHLAVELFRTMTGIQAVHIPYKGTGAAVFDLIGGQVPLCFCTLPSVLPHVKTKRLVPLAVTTTTRSSAVPEIPTIAESGVPGYEMSQWYGLLAPAGVPAPIIDRLNGEIATVLKLPEMRARFQADGAEPAQSSPQEFGAFFKAELVKWTNVVKKAGIRPE
jgi:tripartite-type tricarboxylate transporter receptor subunit TctC